MIIAEALRQAALLLNNDTARLDAELLMARALGVSRSELLLRHMRDGVPDTFTGLAERRQAGEPIAYILGEQEFYGLAFKVTPAVLIPRADSETLVAAALRARPDARHVLDCGTGSGALLLATLAQLPKAAGVGIDRSPEALMIAQDNAVRLRLESRARMVVADWNAPGWATPLGRRFDVILANPPYVEDDAPLAASVRDYEPAAALFAGVDGLDDYRALLPQLPALLAPNGIVLVEIGATQADAVAAIAGASGFATRLYRDLAGRPRALELLWKA